MVQIPGKRSRTVPLLILPRIRNAMDVLVSRRTENNLFENNQYFFAIDENEAHLMSCVVLRSYAENASLDKPDLIRSTRLRKYLSTVTQIIDLNTGELEWLSNHLGHEVHIDKEFYRQHEGVVEVAKIGKLLMAVDQGVLSKYGGKKLSDITLDDDDVVEEYENSDAVKSSVPSTSKARARAKEKLLSKKTVVDAADVEMLYSEEDDVETQIFNAQQSVSVKKKLNKKKATLHSSSSEDEESHKNSCDAVKSSVPSTSKARAIAKKKLLSKKTVVDAADVEMLYSEKNDVETQIFNAQQSASIKKLNKKKVTLHSSSSEDEESHKNSCDAVKSSVPSTSKARARAKKKLLSTKTVVDAANVEMLYSEENDVETQIFNAQQSASIKKKLNKKKATLHSSSSEDEESHKNSCDAVKSSVPSTSKARARAKKKLLSKKTVVDAADVEMLYSEEDNVETQIFNAQQSVSVKKKLNKKKATLHSSSSEDEESRKNSCDAVKSSMRSTSKTEIAKKRRRKNAVVSSDDGSDDEISKSEEEQVGTRNEQNDFKRRKISGGRIPWSEEELKSAAMHFKKFFTLNKPPDFSSIEDAQKKFECLKRRTPAQIKSRIWHEIMKNNKRKK